MKRTMLIPPIVALLFLLAGGCKHRAERERIHIWDKVYELNDQSEALADVPNEKFMGDWTRDDKLAVRKWIARIPTQDLDVGWVAKTEENQAITFVIWFKGRPHTHCGVVVTKSKKGELVYSGTRVGMQ